MFEDMISSVIDCRSGGRSHGEGRRVKRGKSGRIRLESRKIAFSPDLPLFS